MTTETRSYAPSYAQDRAEIEDLMARYLFALDYNDLDTFAATFTEDATFDFAPGTVTGRDNIRAIAEKFKERIGSIYKREDGQPACLRHVKSHMTTRIEGDRAWTTAFWFEMADDGPGNSLKMGSFGIYNDELVRQNGRWLFSKRQVLNEFLPGRESGGTNPVQEMDRKAAEHAASLR